MAELLIPWCFLGPILAAVCTGQDAFFAFWLLLFPLLLRYGERD